MFKVALKEVDDPKITRTLSCPANATFHAFHKAIIISFGWALTHLYKFQVLGDVSSDPFFGPRPVVEFSDDEPEEFIMPGMPPPTPWKHSSKINIGKYMEMPAYQGKVLQYEYNFGDGWEHSIESVGRAPKTARFVCTNGEGHGAAEDAGGPYGWENLKEAYRTDSPNPEQQQKRQWYERHCTNGFTAGLGGDRLSRWNQEKVNEQLARLPKLVWKHDRTIDA